MVRGGFPYVHLGRIRMNRIVVSFLSLHVDSTVYDTGVPVYSCLAWDAMTLFDTTCSLLTADLLKGFQLEVCPCQFAHWKKRKKMEIISSGGKLSRWAHSLLTKSDYFENQLNLGDFHIMTMMTIMMTMMTAMM